MRPYGPGIKVPEIEEISIDQEFLSGHCQAASLEYVNYNMVQDGFLYFSGYNNRGDISPRLAARDIHGY